MDRSCACVLPAESERKTSNFNVVLAFVHRFGLVLYGILCQKVPFRDCSVQSQVIALIQAGKKPNMHSLQEVEKQLASDKERQIFRFLKSAMKLCWDSNPSNRPSSNSMSGKLTEFCQKMQVPKKIALSQSKRFEHRLKNLSSSLGFLFTVKVLTFGISNQKGLESSPHLNILTIAYK